MKINSAIFGVSIISGMLVFSLMSWIEILTGRQLEVNRWAVGFVFFASYYANYYLLIARGSGIAFEKHFSRFPKNKRIALRVVAIGISLATLAICFFTIAAYRKAFGFGSE